MTSEELFEDIRTSLRDPMVNAGINDPQTYNDADLIPQVRSAIRHLKARGVTIDQTFSETGALSSSLDDTIGVLVSLRTAMTLLRGDMIRRVVSGEFGIVFRAGADLIDTKTAAIQFKNTADAYEREYQSLLTIVLSTTGEVYGGPLTPGNLN